MVVKVRKLTKEEIDKIKWIPIIDLDNCECPLCKIEEELKAPFGRWENGE